jgi:hypothetical protein
MIELREIAHARSGDKGNIANIGVIAKEPEYYPIIEEHVTAARVKDHFGELCEGEVERYPMKNIHAFNFVLPEALGGGGVGSLYLDNQGKTYSGAILRMELDVSLDTDD